MNFLNTSPASTGSIRKLPLSSQFSEPHIIVGSFLAVLIPGALLLTLPVFSVSG